MKGYGPEIWNAYSFYLNDFDKSWSVKKLFTLQTATIMTMDKILKQYTIKIYIFCFKKNIKLKYLVFKNIRCFHIFRLICGLTIIHFLPIY